MLRSLSGPAGVRSRSLLTLAIAIGAMIVLGFGPARAMAATATYTGASGGGWTTASNWSTGNVPGVAAGAGDDVVIPTGRTVQLNGSALPFTIGTLSVAASSSLDFNAGTLIGAANGTSIGGAVNVNGSISEAAVLELNGDGTVTGAGTITVGDAELASISMDGSTTVQPNLSLGSSLTVASGKTLTINGTLTARVDDAVAGAGTLIIAGGGRLQTLDGQDAGVSPGDVVNTNGTIYAAPGSQLTIAHTAGLHSGAKLVGYQFLIDGDLYLADAPDITTDTASRVAFGSDGLLSTNSGDSNSFRNYGDGVASGYVQYSDATVDLDAPTTIATGYSISSGATTFTNHSTLTLQNGVQINDFSGPGTFTNAADGTIVAADGQSCIGTQTFTSAGTINISGAGTKFQDTYVLQVNAGTVSIGAGASISRGLVLNDGTVTSHGALVNSNQNPTVPTTVHGGTLIASGSVGSLVADGGLVAVQNAAGGPATLTSAGPVTLGGTAALRMQTDASTISRVTSAGAATAGGALQVHGPAETAGAAFSNVFSGTALTGAFASVTQDDPANGGAYLEPIASATAISLIQHFASIVVNPTTVVAGGTVTITGAGFAHGETILFGYGTGQNGGPIDGVTATADANGSFTKVVTVPAAATTLSAIGVTSGANVRVDITTTPVPTPTPTPTTTPAPAPAPAGTPATSLGAPVTVTTAAGVATTSSITSGGATATVTVPAGALPAGTVVSTYPVTSTAGLTAGIPTNGAFVLAFAVSWKAPNGTVPTAAAPITLVVTDPRIKAGDVVYMVSAGKPKLVGTAKTNGTVTVTFTDDPTFIVSGPARVAISKPTLGKRTARVVTYRVACVRGIACKGTGSAVWTHKVKRGKKIVTVKTVVASGAYSVKTGTTAGVAFRLTKAGKALFATSHGKRVALTLTLKVTGGATVSTKVSAK